MRSILPPASSLSGARGSGFPALSFPLSGHRTSGLLSLVWVHLPLSPLSKTFELQLLFLEDLTVQATSEMDHLTSGMCHSLRADENR